MNGIIKNTIELREKHERIKNSLEKRYRYIIQKYKDSNDYPVTFIEKESPIWVCWWQGAVNMPDIVRICYKSICNNSGEHPVKLITKDNYNEYITLPCYIIKKINSGKITLTHLSDILRMNLLYEYGGYWMDATVLLTKTLPEEKNLEFFTIKHVPDITYVAEGRWTIFLIGAGKKNLFFDFAKKFLNEYWKKETKLINYFLIDYIVSIAYDHQSVVRKMIDGNDFYMQNIFDLSNILNQPFDSDRFGKLCGQSYFHKLSWKRRYMRETDKGKPTFYGYLKRKNQEFKESKMDRVIEYFCHARNSGCENNKKKADDLLEEILHDFQNGAYTGDSIYNFGSSIMYLLRNNFVNGNEDEIFSEIDEMAFRNIYYRHQDSKTDLDNLFYYLKLRISGNSDRLNEIILLKNKQLLCQTIDAIRREKHYSIFSEDRLKSHMEDLCHKGFACGLIQNILDSEQHEKIKLKQIKENKITFVIPVRINNPERKRNLFLILEQLQKIPNASVIILEADSQPRFEFDKNTFISYYFFEDHDPVFHRTKYINMMLWEVKSKIAGVWDTDVVVPYEQIISSIQDIQNGYMMSFPYDGRFFTLNSETTKQYSNSRAISFLMENIENFPQKFGTYSSGGAFIVNKDEYLKCGGENEQFYGWGVEDLERVKRIEILGFEILRKNGPLFHLFHPRTSWFDNQNTEIDNRKEFIKICSMTRQELWDDVKTWKISQM